MLTSYPSDAGIQDRLEDLSVESHPLIVAIAKRLEESSADVNEEA